MNLEIEPYLGAGPLKFGITADEVCSRFGPPVHAIPDEVPGIPPGKSFSYVGLSLSFNPDDRLRHIGFDRHFSGAILYDGADLFRQPNAWRDLIEKDGDPYSWVGFIMLLKLGIRLGGFHESADEGPTVSLFEKGRYDSKIARFTPLIL